jgi:hypothetical protein
MAQILHKEISAVQCLWGGGAEVVGLLLQYGADPRKRRKHEKVEIGDAIRQGHTEILSMLLDHGVTVSSGCGSSYYSGF